MKRPVRKHIIIAIALGLVFLFIANAGISAFLLKGNSISLRAEQFSGLTITLSEHTSQNLYIANAALKDIAESLALAKVDNEKAYRQFAVQKVQFEYLQGKIKGNAILNVATFVSKEGKVLNYSRSYPPPEIDLSNRDYFQYLKSNNDQLVYYSKSVKNKGNGQWIFYLARRITGAQGEFLGLVLVGISVDRFSSLFEKVGRNLGEGVEVSLYRQDKTLLTRWPLVEDIIGQVDSSHSIDESLSQSNQNEVIIYSPSKINKWSNGADERMASYRYVVGYPLIVGVTAPQSLYLSDWYKNVAGLLLSTLVSLFALFIAASLLIRSYSSDAHNQYLAHYDFLTGLPNRLLLKDRLQIAIKNSKSAGKNVGLLFLDLDNFKEINDSYGHPVGDFVLKEIADRMRACLRESDTVGRIGGDEFLIILPDLGVKNNAIDIAKKVRYAISQPIACSQLTLTTAASIGVALYPDNAQSAEALINKADIAMFYAKSYGKNRVAIYDPIVMNVNS